MSKTVFVGLSGGVDSATSAALLIEQGYTVVGAFIKIWQPEFIECTWAKDRLDAMRIAVALGIPFEEVDLSEEYKKEVVHEMIASYSSGETPNPDVACNTQIKFGAFASWAKMRGADAVATGHYARIRHANHGYELLRGADPSKDQSYFLHQLHSSQLESILFPIGGMLKRDVRALATKLNIPVASKPDSQGLCFVGDVSMRDFLKRYITVRKGDVLNQSGEVIGSHEGAALYTEGQRHGFTITKQDTTHPYYITGIDTANNTVSVSTEHADAQRTLVKVRDVHWIGKVAPDARPMSAQFRYREQPVMVRMKVENGTGVLEFDTPRVASPGQSVVFYDEDVCLGGAIISKHAAN